MKFNWNTLIIEASSYELFSYPKVWDKCLFLSFDLPGFEHPTEITKEAFFVFFPPQSHYEVMYLNPFEVFLFISISIHIGVQLLPISGHWEYLIHSQVFESLLFSWRNEVFKVHFVSILSQTQNHSLFFFYFLRTPGSFQWEVVFRSHTIAIRRCSLLLG